MTDREPPRNRADYLQFQALQTRWNDNDQFGHIYNATYYELFDEAMNLCLLPMGMLDFRSGGPIPVVAENGCTYFRELSYPDRLEVGLRVEALGRSSFRIGMGMFRVGDQTEAARAFFAMVNVDNATRRPVPLDPALRQELQALMVR